MNSEFERLKLLIGDMFEKFKNLKILVLGVGGVGGYVVESLARSGVSDITLVDYDIVDITNINRQIIALHSTIGKKKVEVLKERLLDINKDIKITIFDFFYNKENKDIIFNSNYDYIIDCCDSLEAKETIIREAVSRNIKIISSMGAGFKLDPTKIKIVKLKDTNYDKIAKILRYKLRDNKDALMIPVVYSNEEINKTSKIIASNSYIPSMFGLHITSYIINSIIKDNL